MIELIKIGEHSIHDASFEVNRPNGHPMYLLLIVQSDARFLIDNEWKDVDKGTVFIFKPGQKHRYCAKDGEYINDWAHIQSDKSLLGEYFPYGMPIKVHDCRIYENLFHMLCEEYFGVKTNRSTVIYHLLMVLLYKIQSDNEDINFQPIYYEISKIREAIYRHPEYHWTVSYMAEELKISKAYLQSLYQKYFNTTCINDVIESRMQAAEELLLSTNKVLDEISQLCGYNSTEHFVKQFKKRYGITPGKFRSSRL